MVKSGYKETEVGEIPEGWGVEQICNIAKVVDSLHATPKFSQDGYPMVRVTDIKPGNLKLNGTMKVSEKVFIEFTRNYTPKRGDIVLSRVGSYGVSSFVDTDEQFCMGQNTVVINSNIPARYLYFILNSQSIREQIENESYGTGYKSLSLKNINELFVPVPICSNEQKAIAKALSDVDELIVSLEKLITKKQDIKTAAMQQLLTGKKRLPGFGEGKGYKQTELGQIPEDWLLQSIGGSFEFKNGLNKAKKYFGHGTPIINYMDVYSFSGLSSSCVAGKVTVTPEEKRAYSTKKGDVFFTRTSETVDEIGVASTLLDDIEQAVFSGFVLRARPFNDLFESNYKKYCFGSDIVRKQIMSTSSYTTRALTNGRLLSGVLIPLPKNTDEQRSIALIISDMEQEIESLEIKLGKTKAIKQGMMQELLTGKTRLI